MKQYVYEGLGTAILVFLGCSCCCLCANSIGLLGIGLVFGLTYSVWTILFNKVCSCHLNPIISFAAFITNRLEKKVFFCNVLSQFIGGIVGTFIMILIIASLQNPIQILVDSFWANGYDFFSPIHSGLFAAIVIEFLLSMLLVVVYLAFIVRNNSSIASVLFFGIAYALIVAAGYSFTCCSVNPARSFGAALFFTFNGDAIILLHFIIISCCSFFGCFVAVIVFKLVWNEDCGKLRFNFFNLNK